MARRAEPHQARAAAKLLENFKLFTRDIIADMDWDRWAVRRRRDCKGWDKRELEQFIEVVEARVELMKAQIEKVKGDI